MYASLYTSTLLEQGRVADLTRTLERQRAAIEHGTFGRPAANVAPPRDAPAASGA